MSDRTLVTGATGAQGGAVARALLEFVTSEEFQTERSRRFGMLPSRGNLLHAPEQVFAETWQFAIGRAAHRQAMRLGRSLPSSESWLASRVFGRMAIFSCSSASQCRVFKNMSALPCMPRYLLFTHSESPTATTRACSLSFTGSVISLLAASMSGTGPTLSLSSCDASPL